MSNQSLTALEKKLPAEFFMRVHRSYIINKNKVTALKGKDLTIEKTTIPISARYFELVKKNPILGKLLNYMPSDNLMN